MKVFDKSALLSQLYIMHSGMFVKNSEAHLCLPVVLFAILEYLPLENIGNLSIFIKALINSPSFFSDLKISFIKKFPFFTLCLKYFPSYCMFAWFNFMMFFSLVFLCTHLWTLVYLQFTKYALIFIWLIVTANKFEEDV